jgi:hypothetical protein
MNGSTVPAVVQIAAEAAVQRAKLRGDLAIPLVVHGTIIDIDISRAYSVTIDGDTAPIQCVNVSGLALRVGQRATVLHTPPHQALIIGTPGPFSNIVDQMSQRNIDNYAADSVTDMVLPDTPAVAGRTYGLHLHSQVNHAVVGTSSRWQLNARVNGSAVGRFADFQIGVVGANRMLIDSFVFWTPNLTSTYDIDVFADQVAAGGALDLEGSNATPRWLTVFDWGYPVLRDS